MQQIPTLIHSTHINHHLTTSKYFMYSINRVSEPKITKLRLNEVFVFGSNTAGNHGGGAALIAKKKFGAKQGLGTGFSGKSYAIPTLIFSEETEEAVNSFLSKCKLSDIEKEVEVFIDFAKRNPETRFLVTEIGCGIAGFKHSEIAKLFVGAIPVTNIHLPQAFWDEIERYLVSRFESRFGNIVDGKYSGDLYLRGYAHALPASFTGCGGYLDLRGYAHALPASFTGCGGNLYLSEYAHALPASFTGCGGNLYLSEYAHALPASFTGCGGNLYLSEYAHALPASFTGCGGYLDLRGYAHALPASFTGCGGYLDLRGYAHALPASFTGCGGYLDLSEYAHALPASFTGCGGNLYLSEYAHALPASFTGCGGNLYLSEYAHALPASFTGCGGNLYLSEYAHALPASFTGCGGYLDLRGYAHALPASFTGCGGYLDLRGYAHALPASFTGCGGNLYLSEYAHALPEGFEKGKFANTQKLFDFELKSIVFLPLKLEIPTGMIKAFKKVKRWGLPVIVTLMIPADAKRCHKSGQRKCRAEYAEVVEINITNSNVSIESVVNKAYSPHVEYKVGEIVRPDKYDGNEDEECSHGINFFLSRAEAERY
jgi:hypothetical protein